MAAKNRSHTTKGNSSKGKKTGQKKLIKVWEALKTVDLRGLGEKIKEKFKWSHTPRSFQQEAIEAQLQRKDTLIHAGTGSGKTVVAAGPHAHEKMKGMVTIFVSPLIALQEEQVSTFQTEFSLSATAVNSKRGGISGEVMTKICEGEWQIVIISPELLLSKRFINGVLKQHEFASRLLSIVVDEAHVVSHWGASFRKAYGRLGILKALLPKGTPFVAMSATLPPRIRSDVLSKLQLNQKEIVDINIGNDRPNVSIVVRPIHNTMSSYSDLDFVIPQNVQQPSDIKKTMIYADQIAVGVDIEDRLYERCPESFRNPGIIRPYSAAFSQEYREHVMLLFRLGIVRVLICTDAAGMGCNIPDIDVVVQWKLPASVSSFVQRAGRAARGEGRTGLGVLLVEKSAYDADLLNTVKPVPQGKRKARGVRQSDKYDKAKKGYAVEHGVERGSSSGNRDSTGVGQVVPLDRSAKDEGLHTLVQTGTCRRRVLTEIYGNSAPNPTVPCCDICDPTLLNLTRPAPVQVTRRAQAVKQGLPYETTVVALHRWRKATWGRDFAASYLSCSVLLSDNQIERLSSVGPVHTPERFEKVLGGNWSWNEKYGQELLILLKALDMPPMKSKPRPPKAGKRAADPASDSDDESRKESAPKRPRTQNLNAPATTPAAKPSQAPPPQPPTTPGPAPNFAYQTHAPAFRPYLQPYSYHQSPAHIPTTPQSHSWAPHPPHPMSIYSPMPPSHGGQVYPYYFYQQQHTGNPSTPTHGGAGGSSERGFVAHPHQTPDSHRR